jgi:cytochrome c oxidase subunit 4
MADVKHETASTMAHEGTDHHGPTYRLYMTIAAVLAVCTALSFVFNQALHDAKVVAFLLILLVAIVKATLVGVYFMHLKWDWKLLYYLIIPAFILGVMMMVVLSPDTLIGPYNDAKEGLEIAKELP